MAGLGIRVVEDVAVTPTVETYILRCEEMSEDGKYEWWSDLADILRGLQSANTELDRRNREMNREMSGLRRSYFEERAKVVRMEKGGR